MSHIIGIDLGTTNSLASFWNDGKVELIPNSFGEYLTPSVVSFDENGALYVGKTAKERIGTHPESTFFEFKRYMGRKKNYKCFSDTFTPVELSALVLKSLKEDAERFFGEEVEEAVISVPAYFDDRARKATKEAGALAGLRVDRIINEPSAAALGYLLQTKDCLSFDEKTDEEELFDERTFLVFDFGGGTLDVSVVDSFENVIEIVSISGDNRLGGMDFDKSIANYFLSKCEVDSVKLEQEAMSYVIRAAEHVKRELSEHSDAVMKISYQDIQGEITISDLELAKICAGELHRIYEPVNTALREAKRSISSITDVVMVGGSSRMPIVQRYLKHLLKRNDISVSDPDSIVARGMGIYAGIKERKMEVKDLLLTDVCPFSLGCAVYNENRPSKDLSSVIISRNSPLPISRERVYHPVFDGKKASEFHLFQGEEMYADDNRRIGEIRIDFPRPATVSTQIYITFTYDINGILIVNADVPEFDIHKEQIIYNDDGETNPAEREELLQKLRNFKADFGENEDNNFVQEWGKRLYTQVPAEQREPLLQRLMYFEYLLQNDPFRAQKFKKQLKLFLVAYEVSTNGYTMYSGNRDSDWTEEDDELEELFKEWEEGKRDNDK